MIKVNIDPNHSQPQADKGDLVINKSKTTILMVDIAYNDVDDSFKGTVIADISKNPSKIGSTYTYSSLNNFWTYFEGRVILEQ